MTHQRQRANGMLCLLMELMVFVWLLGKISPDKRAAKDDTGELVSGVSIASLGAACGVADARHIARMRYESADEYSVYSFYISLHPPFMDTVVSKGILSTMQYPSVNEVHSVCEHLRESVECGPGRVFVEVGSSVGMVSLYAASRGMQVLAFDPVLPNVERVRESVCLNGRVHCAERNEAGEACIVNTSEWGPYAPGNFRVFWKLVGSASGKRVVQTEPGNLAATMRGGGHYSGEVGMVQLDSVLGETPVELLLLTCQGFEYDALVGAMRLLSTQRIQNIIWRRHHIRGAEDDDRAQRLAHMLLELEYGFYNLEAARRSADGRPEWIPPARVLEYVMQHRAADEHPNILAVLSGEALA